MKKADYAYGFAFPSIYLDSEMTMGDPNGTDGKSLDDGGEFMDCEDEEDAPPNAGAQGQGTTAGRDKLARERRDHRAAERKA